MINIDLLDADERATHRVFIQGEEAGFVVMGPNSAEYHRAEARIAAASIKSVRANDMPDLDTDEGAEAATKQSYDRATMLAELCTVDWFGFESSGEPVPFSRESLHALLTKRPRWALTIARAVEVEANFTRG